MNNGIVLKVNHSSVVVLTANGEYVKCKKILSSYSIGEEIQFPNNAIILNKKMKLSIPKLIPVVIASGLILFSFIFVNVNNNEALAAGKVTINSEAKLSLILDKQLKVIALKGHNEQGKQVIDKMDHWRNEPLHLVMDDLVDEMENSKVIEPNEIIKLTGEMRKEFKNKQSKLNHELQDIQDSNSHFNVPNSKELDQQKVKTQNQSQNRNKEQSVNSNSTKVTKVTKGETNYKNNASLKSPTIEKVQNNSSHSKEEVKSVRHQDEHWGNKQRQWNHKTQDEHHESSNQNHKKQYNNNEKHPVKKKNDDKDDRELRRSNNDQGRNENKEDCHGCNNRSKNNQNENNNGWKNGNEKHSD